MASFQGVTRIRDTTLVVAVKAMCFVVFLYGELFCSSGSTCRVSNAAIKICSLFVKKKVTANQLYTNFKKEPEQEHVEDRLHWISRVGGSGIDIVGGIACRSGVTRNGGQQQTGLNYLQDVVRDEVAVLACVNESGIGNSFKPFVVEVVKLVEILQTNRRFFRPCAL